jgi:hypothetical protein
LENFEISVLLGPQSKIFHMNSGFLLPQIRYTNKKHAFGIKPVILICIPRGTEFATPESRIRSIDELFSEPCVYVEIKSERRAAHEELVPCVKLWTLVTTCLCHVT